MQNHIVALPALRVLCVLCCSRLACLLRDASCLAVQGLCLQAYQINNHVSWSATLLTPVLTSQLRIVLLCRESMNMPLDRHMPYELKALECALAVAVRILSRDCAELDDEARSPLERLTHKVRMHTGQRQSSPLDRKHSPWNHMI